ANKLRGMPDCYKMESMKNLGAAIE
ncbi:type II toxin-antitoxin system RelE/ParE family toxin, partial [Shigella flexneri]|nr:type II toxin-antitoxin system RelE/ParE family toxin [Shigella flexneri]EFP9199343.1 type II toxin-antitoxin system RelE/ParE family toxin [Shigella flexneri]EFP9428344.1 type II toxin-antitoxin system RelE/ParE family toxin [Shigella flexneri]EFP9483770.1 type II toxin-antitoxin system RelE/ParE family toxin [Shigella flexneri]EFW4471914.1 type II toxin-antitoxin system RelE/ParE family toxin [Shigella flexneri]